MSSDLLYIRPCPVVGDIEFPPSLLPELLAAGFIAPDDESEHPGEFHFYHVDDEGPLDKRKADVLVAFFASHGVKM